MPNTDRRVVTGLRPSADAISRVRNRAAALADAKRRRDSHPDPETSARYQRALDAYEQACDAARTEGVLATAQIQAAVRDAAGRPDRLGPLLAIADNVDEKNTTEGLRDLFEALRAYHDARHAKGA
jgi:hypothetical protein